MIACTCRLGELTGELTSDPVEVSGESVAAAEAFEMVRQFQQ